MRALALPILALLILAAPIAAPVQAAQPGPSSPGGRPIVYLQPLHPAPPPEVLRTVEVALRAFFPVEVRRLPVTKMPPKAWYPPRHRWRADVLVDWLAGRLPKDGAKILGLTQSDISTTKGDVPDWGVLGLATLDGKGCVLSTFRARRRTTAVGTRERIAKVAVHEVGHTFGLEHCPTEGCLMEDARGQVATLDPEDDLCPRCRAHLKSVGIEVPVQPARPWRSPRHGGAPPPP